MENHNPIKGFFALRMKLKGAIRNWCDMFVVLNPRLMLKSSTQDPFFFKGVCMCFTMRNLLICKIRWWLLIFFKAFVSPHCEEDDYLVLILEIKRKIESIIY